MVEDSDESILERARKFLQESDVQSAPESKKIEFLRSKGISMETIEKLLDASRGSIPERSPSHETNFIGSPHQLPQARSSSDVPPIVTYPEFLLHSQKPSPLMTARRLLYTAYFTGGLMAAFYGLSKHVVAPMTESLTEARHDFASHTQTQIQQFNEKLRKAVSIVPPMYNAPPEHDVDIVSSNGSAAESDPTELYHRDFGTQTSPDLSRRASTAEAEDGAKAEAPDAVATAHQKRLEIMQSHVTGLIDEGRSEEASIEESKSVVKDLGHYLDTLTYPVLNYSNYNYEGIYGTDSGPKNIKDDAVDSVKREVRSIKGVLLSARNFPSTVTMAVK